MKHIFFCIVILWAALGPVGFPSAQEASSDNSARPAVAHPAPAQASLDASRVNWNEPNGDYDFRNLPDAAPSASQTVDAGREQSMAAIDVYRNCSPAVVQVRAIASDRSSKEGSGFFINGEGSVVTASHILAGAVEIQVTSKRGRLYKQVTVAKDNHDADVAVLAVAGAAGSEPYLSLADSSAVAVGERILVVGHPLGLDYTLSEGIVSARRAIEATGVEVIQFTAPVSAGCSGSPLLDERGRVVGIVSVSQSLGQNLNFAVSTHYVGSVAARPAPPSKEQRLHRGTSSLAAN